MTRARTLADLGSQSLATDAELASGLAVKAPIDSPTFTGSVSIPDVDLGTWTTYTPTYFGFTLGNGSENHRYIQIGKSVFLTGIFTFGSTSTFTGTFRVGFPVTANSGAAASYGAMSATEAGVGLVTGICVARPWEGIIFYKGGSTPGAFTPTAPFTWGSGDVLGYSVTYEAL